MPWIKSSFCKADQPMCVEVDVQPDGWVKVRDSAEPNHELLIEPMDWAAFIAGVKNGEFD